MKSVNFSYFLHLLKCGIDGAVPLPVPEKVNIGEVINISCRQNTETAVYESVLKLGIKLAGEGENEYRQLYYKAIARDSSQQEEYKEAADALRLTGAEVVPLKGICLKKYYPKSYLRPMGDIDLYCKMPDFAAAGHAMESIGYSQRGGEDPSGSEITFLKEPNINIDLHRTLFNSIPEWENYFEAALARAVKRGEEYLDDNDMCVLLIMHAAKHFEYTGFGIKPVADLYVMQKYRSPDREIIRKALSEVSLLKFGDLLYDCVEAWFCGGINTTATDIMAELAEKSSNYENPIKSRMDMIMEAGGAYDGKPRRIKFFLSRIFISKEKMYALHPFCASHKALLPLFYIFRFFSKIFSRSSFESGKKTLHIANSENIALYNELEKIAGIAIKDKKFKE